MYKPDDDNFALSPPLEPTSWILVWTVFASCCNLLLFALSVMPKYAPTDTPANIAITAITTTNSTSVNPFNFFFFLID